MKSLTCFRSCATRYGFLGDALVLVGLFARG